MTVESSGLGPVVDALVAAGFAVVGGNGRLVTVRWPDRVVGADQVLVVPGGSVLPPDNRVLVGNLLAALARTARRGAVAQQAWCAVVAALGEQP